MAFIKPISVMVKNLEGVEKPFIISRFPATVAREILAKYPTSNIPKLGDFATSKEAMFLLMRYVAVPLDDGRELPLTTEALINNHVDDGEQLIRLEIEALKYNTSFFGLAGKSGTTTEKMEQLLPSIIKTLSPFLQQLSANTSQPSKS